MVDYNEKRNIESLRNIFGSAYLVLSNVDELTTNYQELEYQKKQLLERMQLFISVPNPNKIMSIETWQFDLLLLEESKTEINPSDYKYYTYYSFKELDFIKLLKSISQGKNNLTEEEYNLLYYFIHNKKAIEDMISNSGNNLLIITPQIVNILYHLSTTRHITVGHNIKAYERLCHNLDITKYPNGPELELKPSEN